MPASTNLTNPQPFYPTAAQTREYLKVYDNPYVRGLRTELDRYASGTAAPYSTGQLKPFGRAFAKNHFVVFSVDAGTFGGVYISVIFGSHPTAIYTAWVYLEGGTRPSLRAFEETRCSADEQRFISTRFTSLIALGDDETLIKSHGSQVSPSLDAARSPISTNHSPRSGGKTMSPTTDPAQPPIKTHTQSSVNSRHTIDDGGCEEVTIEDIFDNGAIVELLDGRRLRVTAGDEAAVGIWVPPADGLLCDDDKLINKDDNERVEVEPR